LSYNSKRCCKW